MRFKPKFAGVIVSAAFVLLPFVLLTRTGTGQIDRTNNTSSNQNTRGGDNNAANKNTNSNKPNLQELLAGSRAEQEKLLNEKGPQVSKSFSSSRFSVGAFVQAGWAMVVEYKLEEGAEGKLQVSTFSDRGLHDHTFKLAGVDIGNGVKRDVLHVPDDFKEREPGYILITASKKDDQGKKQRANIMVYSLGVGVADDFPGLFNAAARPPRQHSPFILARFNFFRPNTSDITITPELLDTAQGQMIQYKFIPPSDFGAWSANFGVVVNNSDGESEVRRVTEQYFNTPLNRGNESSGTWNGKNSKGKVKKGQYQIAITAWWSSASVGNGSSCVLNSDSTFTVQ